MNATTGETETGLTHRAARAVADSVWGDRSARVGLATRGVVYVLLAYLVGRIAFGGLGEGGTSRSASGPGVAQTIAAQRGGRLLLVVLAAGLFLFALFSLLDAVLHHDDEDSAVQRWGDRLVSVWGAILYGAFGLYCLVSAAANSTGQQQSAQQSDQQQAQWSARVLRWPIGVVWLGLAGTIVLVIAVFVVARGVRATFRDRLERQHMSGRVWRAAVGVGVAGYIGQAGLFGVVGFCVLSAAIEDDPQRGQGADGAARLLADSVPGAITLALVAVGLFSYGLYLFVEARYRKV